MKNKFTSPAKINLFLNILGKESANGYHYLKMLMAPISIYDTLYVEEASEFSIILKNSPEDIPIEKNIIYKIYNSVQNYVGKKLPKFNVILEKNIPSGAGMGGGSSNGASFLLFLNEHLSLDLNISEMVSISSRVGSDIPFFLYKSPAIVEGLVKKFHLLQSITFLSTSLLSFHLFL